MKYEIKGRVLAVGETKAYGNNGFEKREIVVDCAPPQARWNNPLPFTLSKERCALGDGIAVDDEVTIQFALNGREWNGPNGVRYFIDLSVLSITKDGGEGAGDAGGDAFTNDAKGAWAAWCKHRDEKDAAGFTALLAQVRPVVADVAKKSGKKFSQVAQADDWAAIIATITGAGAANAGEGPADDDPDNLPF